MKRADREIVEYVVNLYLWFVEKNEGTERIAWEGPGIQEKITEFGGVRVQTSAFKPDVMSKKGDLLKAYRITDEERAGHGIIMEMPPINRACLVVWQQNRNRYNEETQRRYSLRDCLRDIERQSGFRLGREEYDEYRKEAELYVLERYRSKVRLQRMKKLSA